MNISHFPKSALLFGCIIFLSSCSTLDNMNEAANTGSSQWDFDHHVQFKKTKIDEHNYHLEVIRNDKVNFARLATFLMRKSYDICGSYGYKIEVLEGVEGFLDKKAMPNFIQGSLVANIECIAKIAKN